MFIYLLKMNLIVSYYAFIDKIFLIKENKIYRTIFNSEFYINIIQRVIKILTLINSFYLE